MSITITAQHLAAIAGRSTPLMAGLADWINQLCPQYEIDTPQEFCHFLAQACHESDHFVTLREYASGRAYEGRADLGNTQPGDGVRFKGRGIFQTTGRANYMQLGIKKGQRDLFINKPELLEQPEYAVWSACEYWRTRGLNDIANHADRDVLKKKYRGNVIDVSPVEYISLAINGGYNGLAERKKFYAKAQQVLVAPRDAAVARGLPAAPVRAKPATIPPKAPAKVRTTVPAAAPVLTKAAAKSAKRTQPARKKAETPAPAAKLATAAPDKGKTIHSGSITAINGHQLTVQTTQGKKQTLETSALSGLKPGVLIAWCEEDCTRLRIGERWTHVKNIAPVRRR
jgi:putative chitinase